MNTKAPIYMFVPSVVAAIGMLFFLLRPAAVYKKVNLADNKLRKLLP